MFSPNRDQVRRFLMDAWQKCLQQQPATPLETLAADVVAIHPEYHSLLASGDEALTRDWNPDSGETNPFLHLSLHLAIAEQLQVNQPPGIRQIYLSLRELSGDEHDALHHVLDCLAETIWRAQRDHKPLDNQDYLALLNRKLGRHD